MLTGGLSGTVPSPRPGNRPLPRAPPAPAVDPQRWVAELHSSPESPRPAVPGLGLLRRQVRLVLLVDRGAGCVTLDGGNTVLRGGLRGVALTAGRDRLPIAGLQPPPELTARVLVQ